MRVEGIEWRRAGEQVLGVSGLGAATILAPEAGLHVREIVGDETRDGDRSIDRVVVAVEIAPWLPSANSETAEFIAEGTLAGARWCSATYSGGSQIPT